MGTKMPQALKHLTQSILKGADLRVARCGYIDLLEKNSRGGNIMAMLLRPPQSMVAPRDSGQARLLEALRESRSQLGQDMFALSQLGFEEGGYFVEFGATDGIELSNSYVLEKHFGWSGIVAEPAKRWHKDLTANRHCHIETDCVWKESNATLTFNEADEDGYATIDSFSSKDVHSARRKKGRKYEVKTISLLDLLEKYRAPREISYLSIDTEGSEYDILSHFDFEKYSFRVITCEHNFTPSRERIHSLLTGHGYVRVLEEFSSFDDWYVATARER